MNTKICKACGQTNFAEATVCSNCHLSLGQVQNKPAEKSNKLYWILGGIAALGIFGGIFITVVAGAIYYFSGPKTTFVGDNTNGKPVALSNTNSDEKTKKEKISPFDENQTLKEFLESKHSTLGEFKQRGVSKIENNDKKIFKESADEAFALYSKEAKNPLEILFSMAKFSSVADAQTDAAAIRKEITSKKNNKIVKESNFSDGVIISYKKNKLIGILDCKGRICSQITGIDGGKVADFYKEFTSKIYK
jgi:hypothetical protein